MDIPLHTELETEHCILKCVSEDDVECVWTASRVPGFTDGMLWDPADTKEEIVQFIYTTIEDWKKGEDFGFSIYDKNTEECLGRIGIRIRPKEGESVWNIGYWVHPDQQGKGYATEATKEVINWGFSVLNAKVIKSNHATWNEASGKVLQKAGFKFVEHLDCGFVKHGKEVPEEAYAISREEWEG
jgi:ribosomal-protein-alanine N-acetyltransferase